MSELYDKIVGQRGSFERLIARIPGFRGYLDKDARRSADRMLRDYIAGELAKRVNRLVELQKTLLDKNGLAYMSEITSVRTKMQTFHDRVKTAAPGYSGFFEKVKVGSEELEKIYSFDEAQIQYADKFDEALGALQQAISANAGIDEALSGLDRLAVEANEAFSMRDDVLTNLNKSL